MKSSCYLWTDKLTSSTGNASQLPPSYKGVRAVTVSCNDRHHFQLVKQFSKSQFKRLPLRGKPFTTYCQKIYSIREETGVSPLKLIGLKLREKGSSVTHACAIQGTSYAIDTRKGFYYFDELFNEISYERRS